MADTEASAVYQVMIVRYGTRSTSRSDVYLNYPLYGDADGDMQMDYFFWVIRNETETILVDTGYEVSAGASRGRTLLLDPVEAFARAGIEPGSAPRIIVTHAHYDHIGNLGLFPDSEIMISRAEVDFWTGPHADKPLFAHSVEDRELSWLSSAVERGTVTFVEGEMSPAPGVRVVEIGGHTPGQCVVFVDTTEGPVLLASDSVHYSEELEKDMIFTSVADLVEMYDSFAWIRGLQSSGQVRHVVPGHDPGTLARFTPATGALSGHASTIGSITPSPRQAASSRAGG